MHVRCPQVGRHVKVLPPSSPFFTVTRLHSSFSNDEGAKVPPGLEVGFIVKFRPDYAGDYRYDLVVCTERERFLVPIVCYGPAAALDLPDQVKFPSGAVKCEARQTLLVTNVGRKQGGFALSASGCFGVQPSQGRLAPGETLQCVVTCVPPCVGPSEGELEVTYDNGQQTYVGLRGSGHEMDICLGASNVVFVPTYVTKYSQKGFKILNNGAHPIKFSCRQQPRVEQDLNTSTKALHKLDVMENNTLREAGTSLSFSGGKSSATTTGGGGDDGSSSDDEASILNNSLAAQTRRYKRLRRDVRLDAQLFTHPNFTVFPPEGTIWPNSEMEVIVQFQPTQSINYHATVHVDVEGKVERLPLSVSAQGLGPLCVFMDEGLDIGDAYINTLHEYVIMLQNRGQIDAEFELMPTPGNGRRPDSAAGGGDNFAEKFRFSPTSGKLTPNQIANIKVQLFSDTMGSFSETFMWGVVGKSGPLPFNIKGRVSAPSFSMDLDELNFGLTSFGFKYVKDLLLTNTSQVMMRYAFRIGEGFPFQREFYLDPVEGVLQPGARQSVTVTFIPSTIQKYNLHLVMDLLDIEDVAAKIPILCECAVPKISIDQSMLNFGDCYLRYPYETELTLVNESRLPAHFELVPQDMLSQSLAQLVAEPSEADIMPKGSCKVSWVRVRVSAASSSIDGHAPRAPARSLKHMLESLHASLHWLIAYTSGMSLFDRCQRLPAHLLHPLRHAFLTPMLLRPASSLLRPQRPTHCDD